ncbi:hypothetical protein HJFPF1_10050 [Paramyrothecium foliicola]|nr:hypothetical protein HJFPF1_10050 [Paramyrothecium foliicola]
MRPLRYNVAVSLDGFIAPPNESTDWIVEDTSIDFDALYAEFDVYVMGRKTYEIFAAMGTQNPLVGRPKESLIVISRQLDATQHTDITILRDGYIDLIRELKQEDGRGIWLMGGGWLATECLEAGLLDTIEAAIMPVVLGQGYKLITEIGQKPSYKLTLQKADTLQTGIILSSYKVSY